MVEMAEDNAELDFSSAFKLGLRDPDEVVRGKAITGLWEFEDRSLILSLVEMVKSDASAQVRAAAAMALGKFASLAQDGKILPRDADLVKDTLTLVLQNETEWTEVRRRALESVAPFNTAGLTEYINWAYTSDDLKLMCSSIYSMGRTGESKWLSHLFRELQNPNPSVRYEAASACGALDDEEAAPHLIPLLQDDDIHVQLAVIDAFGEIGGGLAKKALKRCLKDGDPALEDASSDALEKIQSLEDPLTFSNEC